MLINKFNENNINENNFNEIKFYNEVISNVNFR